MATELKDIESRGDIENILNSFYKKAFANNLISHFFTEVVPLDLATHLPMIADFWEAVLFNKHSYRKNVMEIHQHIIIYPLLKKAFRPVGTNFYGNN